MEIANTFLWFNQTINKYLIWSHWAKTNAAKSNITYNVQLASIGTYIHYSETQSKPGSVQVKYYNIIGHILSYARVCGSTEHQSGTCSGFNPGTACADYARLLCIYAATQQLKGFACIMQAQRMATAIKVFYWELPNELSTGEYKIV